MHKSWGQIFKNSGKNWQFRSVFSEYVNDHNFSISGLRWSSSDSRNLSSILFRNMSVETKITIIEK